jgi:hypothetical protein
MSKTTEMEEKAQKLLNECIGIICDLPVSDPKFVAEATGGKIEFSDGTLMDSSQGELYAKALVPTLKWLLEPTDTKPTRRRRAVSKPAQKPDKGNGADASGSTTKGATTPRKKKNTSNKTDGDTTTDSDQSDLPV